MKSAIAVVVGLAVSGWGAESRTAAAFLKINPSVRGEALGGLNPVSAFGAAGMGVNPAGLALMEKNEMAAGFAGMMGGSEYGTVGVGVKRTGGGLGASVTYLRSGTLQGRDAGGNPTATFTSQDWAAGITGAVNLGNGVRAGGTVKGIQESIAGERSNTVMAGDAGLIAELGNVVVGAAALNVGRKLDMGGERVPLPAVYSLGVSVPLGGGLSGLAGLSRTSGETIGNMGVEYRLGALSLRAGYRSGGAGSLARSAEKSGAQALGGMTGGIGITLKSLRIDYAMSQTAAEYGMSQRGSVTWKWGGEPVLRREANPNPAARQARPANKSNARVSTGSHRAYDPAPVAKSKPKKRWVD